MKFCAIIKGECIAEKCIFFKSYRKSKAGIINGLLINGLAACVFVHDWISDIFKAKIGNSKGGEIAAKVWEEMDGTVVRIDYDGLDPNDTSKGIV